MPQDWRTTAAGIFLAIVAVWHDHQLPGILHAAGLAALGLLAKDAQRS